MYLASQGDELKQINKTLDDCIISIDKILKHSGNKVGFIMTYTYVKF